MVFDFVEFVFNEMSEFSKLWDWVCMSVQFFKILYIF